MRANNETDTEWAAFLTWYCQPIPRQQPADPDLARRYGWTSRANRLDEAQAVSGSPEIMLRRAAEIEARRLLDAVLAHHGNGPFLPAKDVVSLAQATKGIRPPQRKAKGLTNFTVEQLEALEALVDQLSEDE